MELCSRNKLKSRSTVKVLDHSLEFAEDLEKTCYQALNPHIIHDKEYWKLKDYHFRLNRKASPLDTNKLYGDDERYSSTYFNNMG